MFKFVSICQQLQFTQPVLPITMWRTTTPSHKHYRNRKITAFWDVTLQQWASVPDILKRRKTSGDANPATQPRQPETFKKLLSEFQTSQMQ